ncbi:MAG: DUF1801 domain-containing protein [Burkholderiaceae bacterium]
MASPPMPAPVVAVFSGYPQDARARLLELRALVYATAAGLDGVGPLTETLKWGQPAYLTDQSRSGTTLRMAFDAKRPACCSLYFNCNTTLVAGFRCAYPDTFVFEGNRAIHLPLELALPTQALADCIGKTLTYHRRNGRRRMVIGR